MHDHSDVYRLSSRFINAWYSGATIIVLHWIPFEITTIIGQMESNMASRPVLKD
jgi:hypothetical protein